MASLDLFAHSENLEIEPGQLRLPGWPCTSESGMGPLGALNPQRLCDQPEVCTGRPCILSESPSPGVSDPLLPSPAPLRVGATLLFPAGFCDAPPMLSPAYIYLLN